MKVKYFDFGGDPQEVTGEQFHELYLAGKVPPEQTVLANGEPKDAQKLIETIEYAKDEALLKAARKAKLEEEQFQKTAPWWLKRKARMAINLIACLLVVVFFNIYDGVLWKAALSAFIPYCVYLVAGGKRYNAYYDIIYCDEHQDIINQIEEKRRLKRGLNVDDTDGRKDHG